MQPVAEGGPGKVQIAFREPLSCRPWVGTLRGMFFVVFVRVVFVAPPAIFLVVFNLIGFNPLIHNTNALNNMFARVPRAAACRPPGGSLHV